MTTSSQTSGVAKSGFLQWHGWKPLGVACITSAVGICGLLWWHHEPAPTPRPPAANSELRLTPLRPRSDIHRVEFAEENGDKIVKIQVVPGGEELIVQRRSGKLLAIHESEGKRLLRSSLENPEDVNSEVETEEN